MSSVIIPGMLPKMRLADFLSRLRLARIRGQARSARLTTHAATIKRLERSATIQANALCIVSVGLEQDFISRLIEFSKLDPPSFGQEVVIGSRLDGKVTLSNKSKDWFDPSRHYVKHMVGMELSFINVAGFDSELALFSPGVHAPISFQGADFFV